MIPASLDSPTKQTQLQAETPRRNQKLAAFAFSIRFTSARSPTGKDGSLERSFGDDKAVDVQQDHLKRYLSFSPKAVHRSLFERQGSTSTDWHPVAAQVFAAVLFADISGFTRLSARLGADHLKAHINAYFGSMIRVIDKYYGDVIKFCGDAVMIVWQTSLTDSDEAKQATALLAAACSLSLLDECGSYDHGSGNQAVSLRLHCGIGVGAMHTYIVGNTARAEYLISGDPLRQIAATEPEAGVGEVVVSPEAFALIKEEFLAEMTPSANYKLVEQETTKSRHSSGSSKGPLRQSLSLLAGSRRTPKGVVPSPEGSPTYSPRSDKTRRPRLSLFSNFSVPPPTPDDAGHSDNGSDGSDYVTTLAEKVMNNFHKSLSPDRSRKKLPEDAIRHLPHLAREVISPRQSKSVPIATIQNVAAFVQEPARAAIQASAMSYLAEIREVVTIFINIRGLEQPLEQGDVQAIQKVMELTLEALGKYRGALRQFVVDDKGCVMILAFGLPRFTHEDNATRAVESSVLIRDSLTYCHLTCKIGITHGQVYCGLVGSDGRHEYAMMGASVNLAARLMASCADGEIRVSDDIVQRTAKSGFVFHSLGKIKAKGYSRPVAVFRPCEKRKGMEFKMVSDQHPLYGRRHELALLQHACDALAQKSKERTFLVRGPAGIGKTRLLSEVARYAQQQHHMTVVAAAGVQSQKTQSYYVLTQLLEIVTGVEKAAGDLGSRSPDGPGGYHALLADWIRNHVSVSEVGGYPLQEVLSLLNDVVDAGFPDHVTILGLRADERQRLQAELLCAILRNSLESQPTMLIIDNLQWVDAQSLLILSMFIEQSAELLCCMATRAQEGAECGLKSTEGVTELVLAPLDIDECAALVSTIVGERVKAQFAHEISEATLCAIHARAGGIPAYIKELASALKEALFTSTFKSVPELTLRAQDATMHQFDQLQGAEQILLKAASVIGLEFSTNVLHYALSNVGAEREAEHMHKILDQLLTARLVRRLMEGDTADKVYMFAHFSLKETAYNLMLEEHRQRLHEAIASYYELQGPLDPVCLQMCVHHYLKTDNEEKKKHYLAAAAAFAREQHCYADLLNCCSQLLSITCGVDEQQIVHALVQGRRGSVDQSPAQAGVFRPRKRRILHMFSFSDMFPASRVVPADRPNVLQQGIIPAWVSAKDVTICRLSEQLSNEWIGLWLAQVGLALFNLGKVREGHSRMVVGLKLMGFSVSTSISRTEYWCKRHVLQRCVSCSPQENQTAKHLETALECYQMLCATALFRARLLEAVVNLEAAHNIFGQLSFPSDSCALCRLRAFSALCLQAQGQHQQAAAERELARRCENGSQDAKMSHMHVDIIDGVWHVNRGEWAAANAVAATALARLDPQQQGSSGSVAMLVMSWAKLFAGDLQGTATLLDELEHSFNFAQRGIITRWTLQTLIVYHSLHGDQRTAELAAEKIKQSTGHRKSNAVRAALVALTHRRSGNHEGSYKYAKYAVQRFATRNQVSFVGHFLFFCVIDAIYHVIVRRDTHHASAAAPSTPTLRGSGGVEEMKKYLTMGTQAFCKMSRAFPAANTLSRIADARLLYVAGQRSEAASELEKCVSDECTFQNATALLDLIRVRRGLSDTRLHELKDQATHIIERLNLAFEARQLQALVQ